MTAPTFKPGDRVRVTGNRRAMKSHYIAAGSVGIVANVFAHRGVVDAYWPLGTRLVDGARVELDDALRGVYAEDLELVTDAAPVRLYGVRGDEGLYDTAEEAVEALIGERGPDAWPTTVAIFEWTVHPPRDQLPNVARLLDWIDEWGAEWVRFGGWSRGGVLGDDLHKVIKRDDVKALAEALLDGIADRIRYRMADRHVATHLCRLDGDAYELLGTDPHGFKAEGFDLDTDGPLPGWWCPACGATASAGESHALDCPRAESQWPAVLGQDHKTGEEVAP